MPKNSTSIKQIFELNGMLEKVEAKLSCCKDSLSDEHYNDYAKQIIDACVSLEKVALRAREYANFGLSSIGMVKQKRELMSKISELAHQITITSDDESVKICLSSTLPHYKSTYKCMLTEPLNVALKTYQKEKGSLPKFDKAVMAVVNHVSANNCVGKIRDNDNYEYKQLVNAVAFWLLPDDAYNICDMYTCTEVGDKDFTEVIVMSPNRYLEWQRSRINKQNSV